MWYKLILPNKHWDGTAVSVGGKAWHLMQLQKADLPVPDFFVIPSETVEAVMASLGSDLRELLRKVPEASSQELAALAAEISSLLRAHPFPPALAEEIKALSRFLFGESYKVAVRSSALLEDGKEHSFAGLHQTFLQIGEKDLIARIVDCMASVFSEEALSYRLLKGLGFRQMGSAVIVQQMVKAQKSGVAFSMNPHGNLAEAIVVGGYGLGEGVVDDRVETDTYFVERETGRIRKHILPKYSQVLAVEEGAGVAEFPLPQNLREEAVFTNEEVSRIFALSMQAESLLGVPADIEFSFDAEGRLHLLQMRAITGMSFERLKILDNSNIVESYPGISLPLTFDFVARAYKRVFTSSARAFWISEKTVQEMDAVFANLLVHYHGRIYYRLDNWYRLMSLVYSSKATVAAWEKAVGLSFGDSNKLGLRFKTSWKSAFALLVLLLRYKSMCRRFFRNFEKDYRFFKNYRTYAEEPERLFAHYREGVRRLFAHWHITIVNDFLAFQFFGLLQRLILRFGISEDESLANDLLCGMEGVESEEAVLSLLDLKERVLDQADLRRLFEKEPSEILAVWHRGEHAHFFALVEEHIERYGDRTLAELKLETSSFTTQPALFLELLKNQLESGLTHFAFAERRKTLVRRAEEKVKARLPGPGFRRFFFNRVRRMARYGLKNRENMRFCRTRAYGVVRQIFTLIGEKMAEAGVLENPRDVFFLKEKDLEDFCIEGLRRSCKERVKKQKKIYRSYEHVHPPNRVMYLGEAPPPLQDDLQEEIHAASTLQGLGVSGGLTEGKVMVVDQPRAELDVRGKILVSRMTDPGWVFLMMQAKGLICEKGSLLSHAAIVGRELGIPVVVGVEGATRIFSNNTLVRVDGGSGRIDVIPKKQTHE